MDRAVRSVIRAIGLVLVIIAAYMFTAMEPLIVWLLGLFGVVLVMVS